MSDELEKELAAIKPKRSGDSVESRLWRGALVVVLGALGYFVRGVVEDGNKTRDAVADLKLTLAVKVGEVIGSTEVLKTRVDAQGRRIDDHDHRIEKLEDRFYVPPR